MFLCHNTVNKSLRKLNICFRNYVVSSSNDKTLYEVLNVDPGCSQEEIKEAFIKKSKTLHPDATLHHGKDSHNAFVILNHAYSVLSKPGSRREYDIRIQKIMPRNRTPPQPVDNPHRSANYKSPYTKYDDARRSSDRWTDYMSTFGRTRARRRMEENIDSKYWQDHWEFSKDHGGGGPRIPTHDRTEMNTKRPMHRDVKLMFGAMFVITALFIYMHWLTGDDHVDGVKFRQDYTNWVISKRIKREEVIAMNKRPGVD